MNADSEEKILPEDEAGYNGEPAQDMDENGKTQNTPVDSESLEVMLEEARSEAALYKDEAARAKADFYNYRSRVERDRARDRMLAAEGVVVELLPVLDNLERALEAETDKESSMHKGVSMVQRQFLSAMQNLGLKTIAPDGAFDPSLHEAVASADVSDEEDGLVVETMSKGYMLGEKVLRAARVKVGRKKA